MGYMMPIISDPNSDKTNVKLFLVKIYEMYGKWYWNIYPVWDKDVINPNPRDDMTGPLFGDKNQHLLV